MKTCWTDCDEATDFVDLFKPESLPTVVVLQPYKDPENIAIQTPEDLVAAIARAADAQGKAARENLKAIRDIEQTITNN